MKVLQIVTSAFRCNLEEQDDPVLWITGAMKGAGAELDVLLAGTAAAYLARGQDAAGLVLGGRAQTQPPRIADDLAKLMARGSRVLAVAEDACALGLEAKDAVPGIATLPRAQLPELFREYDQIWSW